MEITLEFGTPPTPPGRGSTLALDPAERYVELTNLSRLFRSSEEGFSFLSSRYDQCEEYEVLLRPYGIDFPNPNQ
jgi:hypothetical protein